jgi:peptidoglycan/LPS O-acetylase OafA/YrhL
MDQAEQAYRRDITGLRAIAVAAVLAFHFDAPLPAGFVGVDIFFVVSGYLITRVLLRVATGRDVARFYWARLLRILPPIAALSAVWLGCLPLGRVAGARMQHAEAPTWAQEPQPCRFARKSVQSLRILASLDPRPVTTYL